MPHNVDAFIYSFIISSFVVALSILQYITMTETFYGSILIEFVLGINFGLSDTILYHAIMIILARALISFGFCMPLSFVLLKRALAKQSGVTGER